MLRRLTLSTQPMIPFGNPHRQSRTPQNDIPLPGSGLQSSTPAQREVEDALDYLFNGESSGHQVSRLEDWADWFNEAIMSRKPNPLKKII